MPILFRILLLFPSLALAAGGQITASQVPRLPSLEPLRALLEQGAPTERLKILPTMDEGSSCYILLVGEFASVSFPRIMETLERAQITPESLTPEEHEFLTAATCLYIANTLRSGAISNFTGISLLLEFLGVSDFEFEQQYLRVLDFWLTQIPDWHFYLSSTTYTTARDISYSGTYFKDRLKSTDPKKRKEFERRVIRTDYRLALAAHAPRVEMDDRILSDFFEVRETLVLLHRRRLFPQPDANPAQRQLPRRLSDLLLPSP